MVAFDPDEASKVEEGSISRLDFFGDITDVHKGNLFGVVLN